MELDLDKVQANIKQATTRDLLNRVTVYRSGMEPDAIVLIEKELEQRGVSLDYMDKYAEEMREQVILQDDGTAAKCTHCYEPAVTQGLGWHHLWGKIPVFPRWYYYCQEHIPTEQELPDPEAQYREDPPESSG